MPRKLFSRQKRFKNIKNDKKIIIASLLLLTMAFPVFAQDSTVIAETNEITAEDLEIKSQICCQTAPSTSLKRAGEKQGKFLPSIILKKPNSKKDFLPND